MKKRNNWLAVMAVTLSMGMMAAGCGQSADAGAQQAAENTDTSAKEEVQSGSVETGAVDLNALTLDEITAKAKELKS